LADGGLDDGKFHPSNHPASDDSQYMKTSHLLVSAFVVSMLFSGCEDQKPRVAEEPQVKPTPATTNFETGRLGSAIDSYIRTPTAAQAADVEEAFAELDAEIAELDKQLAAASGEERAEAKAKADNLRAYRDGERRRYTGAEVRAKAKDLKEEAKDLGDRVEEGAHKLGEGVKDAADALKEGAEDAVDAVRDQTR
jgi:gas vesicle protein